MLTLVRGAFSILCLALLAIPPARADAHSFQDLLARAHAEAAAGHRWEPPGDNVTETVKALLDLVPNATPTQVAELQTLINNEQEGVSQGTERPAPPEPAASTSTAETPPASPTPSETQIAEAAPTPAPPPASPALARVDPQASTPPAAPANAPIAAAVPGAAEQSAVAAPPSPPNPFAANSYARGQAAEKLGDISGARRYYLSAEHQGHAAAARALGRLYDPAYLRRTAVGGIDADPATARRWYERAVEMGDPEAKPLLQALSAR